MPPLRFQPPRTWLIVTVVALVAVVVAVVLIVASVPSVTVTRIDFTSVDNACGADGSQVNAGFSIRATDHALVSVTVVNTDPSLACTVSSIDATTAGFSVTGANLPLHVASNSSQTLSFTVHGPAGGYSGVLTVDVE